MIPDSAYLLACGLEFFVESGELPRRVDTVELPPWTDEPTHARLPVQSNELEGSP